MEKQNKQFLLLMLYIFLISFSFVTLINIVYIYPIIDEIPHFTQIMKFIYNDYTILYYLTVIPGVHLLMSIFMKLLGIFNLDSARYLITLINIITIFPLVYNLSPDNNKKRTFQFFIFPVFFVFYFLIYTDMFSLFFNLITYYLIINKRYNLSGITFFISILMRQNNFLFIALWFILIIKQELCIDKLKDIVIIYKNKLFLGLSKIFIRKIKFKIITYYLSVIFFICFFIINKGLVVGDRDNQFFGIFFNNIWMFFFTITIFFWPLFVYNIKNIKIKLIEYGIIAGIFLFYLGSFSKLHLYNTYDKMLRNRLLNYAISSPTNEIIFFIGVLIGILIIWKCIEFDNKWLFITFGLLLLIPSWLVEWRYMFILFAFILIYRKLYNNKIEMIMTIYWVFLSLIFLYGLLSSKMFI